MPHRICAAFLVLILGPLALAFAARPDPEAVAARLLASLPSGRGAAAVE